MAVVVVHNSKGLFLGVQSLIMLHAFSPNTVSDSKVYKNNSVLHFKGYSWRPNIALLCNIFYVIGTLLLVFQTWLITIASQFKGWLGGIKFSLLERHFGKQPVLEFLQNKISFVSVSSTKGCHPTTTTSWVVYFNNCLFAKGSHLEGRQRVRGSPSWEVCGSMHCNAVSSPCQGGS